MAQGFTRVTPLDNDVTLSGDSPYYGATQHAIKTYVDNHASWVYSTLTVDPVANADYPTITEGIAAANAGDRVQFDSITEQVTVNKVITLAGINAGSKISSSSSPVVTVSVDADLDNFSVEQAGTGSKIGILAGGSSRLRNLNVQIPSGGAGSSGIQVATGEQVIAYNCDLEIVNSTTGYGVYANLTSRIVLVGGRISSSGGVGTNYAVYADNNADIVLAGTFIEAGTIGGSGRVSGWYIDANNKIVILAPSGYSHFNWQSRNGAPTNNVATNDLYVDDGTNIGNAEPALRIYAGGAWHTLSDPSIQPGGAWVHRVDGLRVKYATLDAAMTAAVASDKIKLYAGTYTVTNALPLDVAIEIEGEGPDKTIITCATNNNATIDVTANATLRNLTVTNTGAGASAAGPVAMSNVTLNLDNVRLTKSSGAAAIGYGVWMYNAGTLIVKNGTVISCTAGTSKYGIYNDLGNGTIFADASCEIGGTTQDIFGTVAGSSMHLAGARLTNSLISFSGTQAGFYRTAAGGITWLGSSVINGLDKAVVTKLYESDGGAVAWLTDASGRLGSAYLSGICEGRLSLTSGNPTPVADVTGAANLRFTPLHEGNRVALWNGSVWELYAFTEVTLSLAGLAANTNFDIFLYDNAGTLTMEAVAWSTATARATALAEQNDVYVKSGAAARRYLGTIRTHTTIGQCNDTAQKRFVWNYYNRVQRPFDITDATASWTYDTGTLRPWHNLTTNRVEFVVGVEEEYPFLLFVGALKSSSGGAAALGIGLDSTTAGAADAYNAVGQYTTIGQICAVFQGTTGIGYHYLQILEFGGGATTTFYGSGRGAKGWIKA